MKIPSKDVLKVTSNHLALDVADTAALDGVKGGLPDDLVWVIKNWGEGNFCGQRMNLNAPRQYLSTPLPDNSKNPERIKVTDCVVGSIEGGFWIVARAKSLFLFTRFDGIDLKRPFLSLGDLLEYAFGGGGLYTLEPQWSGKTITPYYVSRQDRQLWHAVFRDTPRKLAPLVEQIKKMETCEEYWAPLQKCLHVPSRELLFEMETEDCIRANSVSVIGNRSLVKAGDPFWEMLGEWFGRQNKP